MNKIHSANRSLANKILACIGLFLILILDFFYWEIPLFGDVEAPVWSWSHIIRSFLLLILTIVSLNAITGSKATKLQWDTFKNIPFEKYLVYLVLIGATFNISLFIIIPKIFSRLTVEDGVIENFSALLLFLGAITSILILWKTRTTPGISGIIKLTVLFLAFLLFIIAMEEVSWFQRQLKIDVRSNDFFKSNEQLEMNFHNFFSVAFEYIYYTSTFLFFVVIPYIYMISPQYSKIRFLSIFIARPYIAIIATIANVYNYEKWDSLLTQIAVFACILILIKISQSINISKTEKNIIRLYIILIIATQLLFLVNGSRFVRYWEVTEYKEFYIAILLFLYPLSVWTQIKNESQKPIS
jgi:hypothetical protein